MKHIQCDAEDASLAFEFSITMLDGIIVLFKASLCSNQSASQIIQQHLKRPLQQLKHFTHFFCEAVRQSHSLQAETWLVSGMLKPSVILIKAT